MRLLVIASTTTVADGGCGGGGGHCNDCEEESDQFHSAVSMGGWEVAVVLLLEEGVTFTDIHSTPFFCCY